MRSVAWFVLALMQVLVPAEFGEISGEVRALNGKPAVSVRVAATAADSAEDAASAALLSLTQTDSAGRYLLGNLPPGRYRILAGLLESPTFYLLKATP